MQTRIDPAKKTAAYSFASLHELGNWIASTRRTWDTEDSRTYPSARSWDLNAGYDASVEMARNGWLEGAERAQEALKEFAPATPEPDTKTDFYGFRPHVPRFCAGAPDSMIRHAPVADMGVGRVLTLIVPINAVSNVSAEHMANFGVAVAQYVNQLEMGGMRVELIGASTSLMMSSNWRVSQTFTIKNADQPLDLAVVAFAIGHPAMFRRLGFALLERCAAPTCHNYGRTAETELSDVINAPVGAIVLNGMKNANEHARTPEKALEYVSKQIEKAIEAQYV